MAKYEARLCVGSRDGPRSTVWRVWTHRDSAYVQSRMMGSEAKLSFHGDLIAQWSRTDRWVLKSGSRNVDRHIARWTPPATTPSRAALVFRIIVPESELQAMGVPRNPAKIWWLDAPGPGYAAVFECYLAPSPPRLVDPSALPFPLATALPLQPARAFVVLSHYEAITQENLAVLTSARQELISLARAHSVTLEPGRRAVAFLVASDGARGMIELNPLPRAA